jgi:hypothetical protein
MACKNFVPAWGRPLFISPAFLFSSRLYPQQPDLTAKFRNPETIVFCQRVMVGTIILYDHVHHAGAFSKKNQAIDVSRVGGVQRETKEERARIHTHTRMHMHAYTHTHACSD